MDPVLCLSSYRPAPFQSESPRKDHSSENPIGEGQEELSSQTQPDNYLINFFRRILLERGPDSFRERFFHEYYSPSLRAWLVLVAIEMSPELVQDFLNSDKEVSFASINRNPLSHCFRHLGEERAISVTNLLLRKHGQDINYQSLTGWSALHSAAFLAFPKIVGFLIENGANPYLIAGGGVTPLYAACMAFEGNKDKERAEIVKLLVGENNSPEDIRRRLQVVACGYTPKIMAARCGLHKVLAEIEKAEERLNIIEKQRKIKVAVVGAGIAGTVAALALAKKGFYVDLFERQSNIFMESSAIPAHLYSGVQYFNDMPDSSIKKCMKDAITFARTFKNIPFILPRPTVIAIAQGDDRKPEDLERVCQFNREIYEQACGDSNDEVFGHPFYSTYTHNQLLGAIAEPRSKEDQWINAFAKYTKYEDLQYPVFLVREYGMDMRVAAGFLEQLLRENDKIKLRFSSVVKKVKLVANRIQLISKTKKLHFAHYYDVVIDASGNNLGNLEAQLDINKYRQTDVKIAGIFKYTLSTETQLPEVYILGRGRPGMFMSHFSPMRQSLNGNEGLAVINITTDDCTYIKEKDKRYLSNAGKGNVPITVANSPEACKILKTSDSDSRKEITKRLAKMIERCGQRHPALAKGLVPFSGITGSVNVVGEDPSNRDSCLDVHLDKHFISINITKAGASVRLAQEVCDLLVGHFSFQSDKRERAWKPLNQEAALQRVQTRYSKLEIDHRKLYST